MGSVIEEVLSSPVNITIPKDNKKDNDLNLEVIEKVITTKDLSRPEVIEVIKEKAKQKLENNPQMTLDLYMIEKRIESAVSPLIEQKLKYTIDIPDIAIIQLGTQIKIYKDFELNTHWFNHNYNIKSEEIIIENLTDNEVSMLKDDIALVLSDSLQNIIVSEMLSIETGIKFRQYEDLIYKLVNQAIDFIGKNKSEQELEKIIYHHKKSIAKEILQQMSYNSTLSTPEYQIKLISAFTPILQQDYTKFKEDDIVKYTENIPAYEIKKKVVGHFSKACHTAYKFESVPEHIFSIVLERSDNVLKWLRPALGQFKIHYGSSRYQPDFVVETDKYIYIVEIKANNRTNDDEVKLKAKAAKAYCQNVNSLYSGTGKKLWKYMLILDIEPKRGVDFSYLEKEVELFELE